MRKRVQISIKSIFTFCFIIFPLSSFCQEISQAIDTLTAAVKTDTGLLRREPGALVSGIHDIKTIVSALGEGDPIHWAQSLTGVSSGADGGSAMYVRGSNSGSNLFSLDGVPIYAYSHLLGLTSVIPSEVIDKASLSKGGGAAKTGNYTAANLNLESKNHVSSKFKKSMSINNFLINASFEGQISQDVFYILSGRLSPLKYEYALFKNCLPSSLSSFVDFNAGVGDLYAKIGSKLSNNGLLSGSVFYSNDMYSFKLADNSSEKMGWRNFVGIVDYKKQHEKCLISLNGAYVNYLTSQEEIKYFNEEKKYLSLFSSINELILTADASWPINQRITFNGGGKFRYASFYTGRVNTYSRPTPLILSSLFTQACYQIPNALSINASAKINYYKNLEDRSFSFDPEFSINAKASLFTGVSIEATYDRLVQYYHTLEGLPLGWSLDMIVPSFQDLLPESSSQAAVDLIYKKGEHSISAGAFSKEMDNLIYFKYAQSLFNSAFKYWKENIDLGKGRSYGAEFLYEYTGHALYSRICYTWSKTNRYDFANINEGQAFHARFDREHVLNSMIQWRGFNLSIIFQSGQWENSAPDNYLLHTKDGIIEAEYFEGINNYQMPNIFRIDLGYSLSFTSGKALKTNHELKFGVYNLTNHFNPFILYFDTQEKGWKMIAMVPIMPNFSYRISF